MKEKHSDKVINYCIDNKLTFAEGYCQLIDKQLDNLDKLTALLKSDIKNTIAINR
jgi:hypothetical protein